jgi:signal transduction histidine kinase
MTAQRARRQLERLDLTSPVGTSVAGQLADIESSGRHMAVVLDELLDVAQLQAGRTLWLVLQPTRLLDLIETAVAAHQSQTEHHALRIVATADPVGAWDSARLARVVDNLLSNAIKYSPAGGEITLHVSEEDDQAGSRWATVRLRDRGLGIPAADLERVFDSFFRARNVGVIAGTGIGLAGARQIVEQHGGTLTAESPHGAGSTFVLRLPLALDSPGRQASHDVALSHEVQDQ